ncbi:protein of unknown function [Singulisphaera sp. GP187]|uniref:DUF927 domain-containing protein n=1 Tax=Singulisphaera sp. GP187 TaxID=1882752 RepID=UPI00092C5CE7|nr:DUF927 domain-containing protein [Singulisphaera sp. GP187]SIO63417.1 protein of unknown function [Singulisphaera sp. GP187]
MPQKRESSRARSDEPVARTIKGNPSVPRDAGIKPPMDYGAGESGFYFLKKVPRPASKDSRTAPLRDEIKIQLTNFLALIREQRIIDDGDSDDRLRREYIIEASTTGAAYRFTVPADQFHDLRRWVDTFVGAPATVLPTIPNHLDHAAAAIKLLSGTPATSYVRTHTGWTETAGARGFLHQGGMIGPTIPGRVFVDGSVDHTGDRPTATEGTDMPSDWSGPIGPDSGRSYSPISYRTLLPKALQKFDLPGPLAGNDLKLGFEAVFELVNAASPTVGFSLLGSCFSAPLGGRKTYVNLIGGTDSGKSIYAGLYQSFYGSKMDSKYIPANWGSTANYLERLLYLAKDVMVVIDDFLTKGSLNDVQRQQSKADQVLRALFNNTGRGRAQGDGEIRDDKPPRANVVSTAELPFNGLSIKNRGFNLDFLRKDLDWGAITNCQENARNGVFAGVMSSFLGYLADHYDQVQTWRRSREEVLENYARVELPGRGRAAGVVASLSIGIEAFLIYGHLAGAISGEDLPEYLDLAWSVLIETAQAQDVEQDDPVEFFFTCLQTAFVSGRAHLKGPEGGCPIREGDWLNNPDAWGWHRWSTEDQVKTFDEVDASVTTRTVAVTSGWRPKGEAIGWMDGTTLYLHPAASLRAAKAIARGLDATVDFNAWTLGKTLYERGLLLRDETKRKRKRYTARENLGGGRPAVLIVGCSNVMPPQAENPSQCRMYDCEENEIAEVLKHFEGLIA